MKSITTEQPEGLEVTTVRGMPITRLVMWM